MPVEKDDLPAEWVDPKDLVPWPENPKTYTDADIRKTVRSIKRFGFGSPITARLANKEIITGHRRTLAALKMKLPRVPVRFMDLSEEEAHKMAVADNRHSHDKKQDPGRLSELLSEWSDDGDDLEGMGFEDSELTKYLGETYESEVEEVDVTGATAEFFLSVNGPLPQQPEVLDALKQHLLGLDGIQVEITTTEL